MNIFRILSSNDGSINEPNVSSFLAYLLNPNEDHGLSSLLLQELLHEISICDENFLSKLKYEERITDLSTYSRYLINIIPEMTVTLDNGTAIKKRDIDILLEVIDNKTSEVLYAICIENKITDASINKKDSQLQDELKGLENYYQVNEISPEIYVVYLTPNPSDVSSQSFEKLVYDKKCHLYWNNAENSIFNKLIKIFNDERSGLVDPINDQSQYLIKSFLSFIKTNFKSYIEERLEKLEKKSYGKPVIDLLKDFASSLEKDKVYEINKLKRSFSEYVFEQSGEDLKNGTRNAHITLSIVNERNRGHYHVKRADDTRKNIFRYIDSSRKKVKLFDPIDDKQVKVYFNNGDAIEYVNSGDLL